MNQREKNALVLLFLGVFFYAIVAMVVSREVLIPHMLTTSKYGNIAGDPQYYHLLAKKKAGEIRAEGMKEFEFQPEGQGPAGVASLLYLIWENPYSVVFLNAFLHGLSVVIMGMILMRWFSLRASIIGIMPLAISPYMMFWFSQLNKDSFVLAGSLFFTYGLLKFASAEWNLRLRNEGFFSLLIVLIGIVLIWSMRPYLNQILQPITGLILVMILLSRAKRKVNSRELIGFALCGAVVLISLGLFGKGGASNETLDSFSHFKWQLLPDAQADVQADVQTYERDVIHKCFTAIDERNWQNEELIPDFADRKLKAMMGQRCLTFTMLETQSNATTKYSFVDTDKSPGGSAEALAYLPRAALLGVFSPWPDHWGYVFNNRPSAFYTISPIEAAMLYLGLIGLCLWIVQGKVWNSLIPVVLSVTVMTIYGMATPFLGALYRYRYPWWMILTCLGIAALLEVLGRKSRGKP